MQLILRGLSRHCKVAKVGRAVGTGKADLRSALQLLPLQPGSKTGREAVWGSVLPLLPMSNSVGIRELRQQASAILKRVAGGEAIVVTEHGHPICAHCSVATERP